MPTNASILADYVSGIGTQGTTLTIDGDNQSVGIGTTLPTSTLDVNGDVNVTGVITATSFYGNVIGDVTGNADTATYADVAGIATYATNSGIATYATNSGIATYADVAGIATYASTAGIATVAENLTGNPTISVTDITATGNISIAGTLTYEDVTNVDSIGIITARSGIDVTSGGINVTGVSTFNDNLDLQDNDRILLGTGDDLQLYHNGSHSYIDEGGTGNLYIRNGTKNSIFCATDGQVNLYHNDSKKFETTSGGVTVTGSADITGTVTIGGELNLIGTADAAKYLDVRLGSNTFAIRGTSGGDANHETLAEFTRNGPVKLLYDNSIKFETTTSGVTVTGNLLPDGNGTRDLGATGTRWANVYTSDLDLSNESKGGNDVDGTWGAYTIQEGENDLFLINRRNGKTYKFVLQEVN